jgi:hypothetical protein
MTLGHLVPPPIQSTGIRWSPKPDLLFTEPVLYTAQFVPTVAGIYVITAPSTDWSPRPFRPLYFGQAGNLKTRLTWAHEKCSDWIEEARGLPIYGSYYLALGRTEEQRIAIEEEFIAHYCPPCNVKANPLSNLAALMGDYRYGK